jgi:UDP-4-amino-4,6-dideoxy-N-acetyl-beta-L-altrosamine transaminase
MRSIPYGRQTISDADVCEVAAVLRSDWLTQGPMVPRFEDAMSQYCGARHAVAVCNATAALHLACRALGLGPGDSLWTSPNTFVASANCALYCGARVDFVDIEPLTYNMSASALAEKLQAAARRGCLPKIVVAVHFSGQPCDMAALYELAKQYGFNLVEDASHAVGADYGGTKVGSCVYSDVTVFSFHPVKIITTGEGGMALSNRQEIHSKLVLLRNHGITRESVMMEKECEGAWYYQQVDLGYNYRMTDIQAALGRSQLQRVDNFVARRRRLAERYNQAFRGLPLDTPWQAPGRSSAWHLYAIRLKSAKGRGEIFNRLHERGIQVNVHYIPVHLQPYYRWMGFKPGDFPNAEAYYENAISLPLFYGLSDADQDSVIEAVIEAVN